MRKDMKDLLVNTGRHGGIFAKNAYDRATLRDTDPDSLPSRIPTGRHRQYGYNAKELGDRLAPLYRFLETNCGRPWDDVYAEIKEVADHRSIRGYHLLQHVEGYVQRSNYDVGLRRSYGPFFVDDDGTLQKERVLSPAERQANYLKTLKRHKEFPGFIIVKPPNPRVEDTKDHWWEKVEGFWYEFITTHTVHSNSYLDLVMVDGEVEIVRIPLKDTTDHETTKRQVDSKTGKRLEAMLREHVAA